jgi:hypothetical protein
MPASKQASIWLAENVSANLQTGRERSSGARNNKGKCKLGMILGKMRIEKKNSNRDEG